VPDWPGTVGYNLSLYPWTTWLFGPWDLFIEHGHRLLGTLAGLLAIGLVIAVGRLESRRWVFWASVGLLLAIVAQGVLGGLRVVLSDRVLAMIHGTTGPLVFAYAVALAVATSRGWRQTALRARRTSSRVAYLALFAFVVVYCQIGLGAWLRHMPVDATHNWFSLAAALHVAVACLIIAGTWTLAALARFDRTSVERSASLAGLLVFVQVTLGLMTWYSRYRMPALLESWPLGDLSQPNSAIVADGMWQTNIVTAHQATGSLLLALLVIVSVNAFRSRAVADKISVSSSQTTNLQRAPA
jgi:cytochrome c oxidase assembly protein subunit 15